MSYLYRTLGFELTPLQARLLLVLLHERIVSVHGVTRLGFKERTMRYLFRKWRQESILIQLHAGLYKLNDRIAFALLRDKNLLQQLEDLATKA